MNLLNLAPAIQAHILALHPAIGQGDINERRLRGLARLHDQEAQAHKFRQLISTTIE